MSIHNHLCKFPALWIPAYAGMTDRWASYWLQGSIQRAGAQQDNTTDRIPLSLDGRGPKPVPVSDTGAEGETRQHNPSLRTRHDGIDSRLRGNDGPGLSYCLEASIHRARNDTGRCHILSRFQGTSGRSGFGHLYIDAENRFESLCRMLR